MARWRRREEGKDGLLVFVVSGFWGFVVIGKEGKIFVRVLDVPAIIIVSQADYE